MRELILKVILIQELLDSISNNGVLQDLIDVGPFIRLSV
jgi:hypothetical protein